MNKADTRAQAALDKLLPPEAQNELKDLTLLALDRTRAAVMSVGQLVESDVLRAAMMTTIAVDLIRGAGLLMAEGLGRTEAETLPIIMEGINIKLGVKK
ncbi:hypothetical protein ABIG06_006291 [Bradyrhizobium sp. USDA 326]|uniref:hypothetical protein n=1 Tax=unclassified Bradyrhizobium TaxID=2631580 RepID=UPI00351616FC